MRQSKPKTPSLSFRLFHSKKIEIPIENVQTMGDLKREIERSTQIGKENLRILRNNFVLNAGDQTELREINLLLTDRLRILTCKPVITSGYLENLGSEVSSRSKESNEVSESTSITRKNGQINEEFVDQKQVKQGKSEEKDMNIKELAQELRKKGCKQAQKYAKIANGKRDLALLLWKKGPARASPTYLSQSAITQIFSQLIRGSVFQEKKLQIMIKPQLWSFLMSKIAEENPYLTQIIKRYRKIMIETRKTFYQIEPPLPSQQQQSIKLKIKRQIDHQLVNQLKNKLPHSRENIETAVAMGENKAQKAIDILLNGYQRYVVQFEQPCMDQQPFFIAKWLMNLPNIKKMTLAMNPKYLEDYTLSLMYLCSPLAEIFIRNWNYAEKVIEIYKECRPRSR